MRRSAGRSVTVIIGGAGANVSLQQLETLPELTSPSYFGALSLEGMLLFLLHDCTQKYEALSEAKPSVYLSNSETFSGQVLSDFQVHGRCPGLETGYSFLPLHKLHIGSKVK